MSRSRVCMRVGIAIFFGAVLVGPIRSSAAVVTTTYIRPAQPDVFITELQTASNASSGDEFVELYNNTDNDIDLADTAHAGKNAWKLQYFSASKLSGLLSAANWTSPYRTISLTGVAPAHDYYLLAASGYNPGSITPDQNYSSTLADDGGALQLIDSLTNGNNTNVTIHDQQAWSIDKALASTNLLHAAPGAGVSLQRLPNMDSQYVNTDGTLTAFTADARISPDNAWTAPVQVEPTGTDDTQDDNGQTGVSDPTQSVGNTGLPTPVITELLPNPASPQTDEANEFIELYNPGDLPFDLTGYSLETGTSTLHDFIFTAGAVLAPHAYRAFYSVDTGLSLSNSGGQARLLDQNMKLLSQSSQYGAAPDGQAWMLDADSGNWRWTLTPTPGVENVLSEPLAKTSLVNVVKKKTTVKLKGKSVTKKAKSAKKAKAVKKKKAKTASTAATSLASDTTPTPAPLHPTVLAGVAVLAVGYGVYEYRHDLGNRLHQFRANRAARRKARS